ncbi:MAG: hypothetical protein ACYDH5_16470, partial [Acidimicrobiales bacterium]
MRVDLDEAQLDPASLGVDLECSEGAQRDPFVEGWLDVEVVWQPLPTSRHGEVLGRLTREHSLTAN